MVDMFVYRKFIEQSPEDVDEKVRNLFYSHKAHVYIFTAAGKPIYTKYSQKDMEMNTKYLHYVQPLQQ